MSELNENDVVVDEESSDLMKWTDSENTLDSKPSNLKLLHAQKEFYNIRLNSAEKSRAFHLQKNETHVVEDPNLEEQIAEKYSLKYIKDECIKNLQISDLMYKVLSENQRSPFAQNIEDLSSEINKIAAKNTDLGKEVTKELINMLRIDQDLKKLEGEKQDNLNIVRQLKADSESGEQSTDDTEIKRMELERNKTPNEKVLENQKAKAIKAFNVLSFVCQRSISMSRVDKRKEPELLELALSFSEDLDYLLSQMD